MGTRYQDVVDDLRAAYDGGAEARDSTEKSAWKLDERAEFLRRVREQGCGRLLEVGAGTGQDSAYFQENGLQVVAIDLSSEMVERCRAKGLDARVMEFLRLDFPAGSFDAVYAMNCLLHVPNADLPAVLAGIHGVIRPGGLFFLGVYGGEGGEGVAEWDVHDPKRFFSWRTDEQIQRYAREHFDIVDFHSLRAYGSKVPGEFHFQSLTLRRPGPAEPSSGQHPPGWNA